MANITINSLGSTPLTDNDLFVKANEVGALSKVTLTDIKKELNREYNLSQQSNVVKVTSPYATINSQSTSLNGNLLTIALEMSVTSSQPDIDQFVLEFDKVTTTLQASFWGTQIYQGKITPLPMIVQPGTSKINSRLSLQVNSIVIVYVTLPVSDYHL